MAHPAILWNLLEEYETLLARETESGTAQIRRELDDVTYTLCVSTGTLTIAAALTAAQEQLATALADPPTTGGTAAGNVQPTA
ncbi:DUF5133 domain-containing protein [Streptomyces sp. NPDC057543]|uniref:DUF5133 domain-containing protein n=1 Tax=Streptomyces sp. NPDC057543 TaxID=3346163 RepID=UPI00368A7720